MPSHDDPSHREQCDPGQLPDNPLPQRWARRYPRHYKDFVPTSFMPLDHTPVYKTKRQQLAEQERARSASPVEPEQAAAPLTEPVVTESNAGTIKTGRS